MGEAHRKQDAHSERYMQLNNKITGPVSVDYTFFSDLFELEKLYASDKVVMFRKNSHPLRKYHVTKTSLQLMITISRRFNTEGSLKGCPINQLYSLMAEEYEDPCSKEQFYAEVHKFIELGILSVTQDGIVKSWKLDSYKRDTGRFILFSPLVFTQTFTDLPIAAQKLYMYIVSRNGERVGGEFKINLDSNCWIYTLTHRSRPVQIRELMSSLSKIEPVAGKPLLFEYHVEKNEFGQWSLRCNLNPAYIMKHEIGAHYRMVPKAKVPYTKTVAHLRMLLHQHNIGEVEKIENGLIFLQLAQLLNKASIKTLRFAVRRIKEMMLSFGQSYNLVSALEAEIKDRTYIIFMDILKESGADRYLGIKDDDAYSIARPVQFFRNVENKFTLKEFRTICLAAVPHLRNRFDQEFKPEDPYYSYRKIKPGLPLSDDTFYLEDYLLELKEKIKENGIAS